MRLPAAFDALRNRDYRLLWLGAVASLTAAQMRQIANGYLAYELTGSAAALAGVLLAQSLPSFFLSMFGGVIADRVKRRRLLMLTQSLICVDSLLITALVVTGSVEVWHIAVVGVFHGSVLSFNQPSRQAYMVELAGQQNVTQAIALYNSGQTSVRIIGPSIAGALVGIPFIGIEGVFIAIASIYTLPVVSLFMIKARPEGAPRRHRAILTEFKAGISYIKNHQVLRILVIVGIIPPMLGNYYQQFLPVFAKDVLEVGPTGLGLMSTCVGIGAFLGAMTVAAYGNMRRRGLIQLVAGALFGFMLLLFGLADYFPVALATLVGVGFAFALFQTLNATLTLASSEPEYYGRVSAVQQINNSLGSFIIVPIGILVDHIGAPAVIVMSGSAIFIFWCIIGLFVRSYRVIELPQAQGGPDDESTAESAPAS